ncbi:hypothetical protein NC653_021027 [Populus alba x Populus x berolinensis]|uniref:MULE transposase domain-containing protein n=1 Tax=Populus alba x Populus x berolinensis TaxID=444605 RepID=A0AAD6MNT5_9ROSI|nr:hypothetical protein NC653_021027 [Populus alba x Populus x berolinensis]
MYQTLRKLGYFKFSDEFKKSGINNVGYMRYLILGKSSKSGHRLLSDDDCFYEVMKHSRVYGLVHIYAELVPLLVNDLDGSNDFPNREKGQFGQNGGVGLNEGIGETFSEGFEYAEDCEVSNATEGMDASVLRNVWNYLMLQSHSSDDDADVGKEGKVPGYEIDHSASSDPGNYDSSDSEAEDRGIKRSRRSITYDPDNPKWLVGMVFNNAEQFRYVVRKFIVTKGYDLRFRKNDSEEVRAWCKPGQLLYAIGRDGNNQMFPISWGVVELESAVTWKWFLDHLMADPNVANGVQDVLRVRRAELFPAFFFSTVPQCDDVGNNIMKAFNGWILDARAKLTVRMLEEITVTIMNRILVKRNCALKWKTPIAPEVFKIFGKNRVEAELGSCRHSMPLCNHCNVHGDVVPETQIALWKLTEIVVQPAVINKGLKLLGMFLNSNTQSDVNIVGNKSEEEQKFSMHQVDQENVKGKRKEEKLNGHGVYVSTRMLRALLMIIIPGPLKMKNADTGSTVHQASTAAKLNQPAQGSTMHNASQNASCN